MNDGFTLIEVLIVMMVITLLSLVFTSKLKLSEDTYLNPENCQLKSMAHKSRCQLNDTIHFNENGNINHAQTIKISNKICVFQLGMGRYSCE